MNTTRACFAQFLTGAALALFGLVAGGCGTEPETRHSVEFSSADEAVASLISAMRSNNTSQMRNFLGADGRDLLDSGDDVSDQADRTRLLKEYDQKHKLVADGAGRQVLELGDSNWPFPIPLVQNESTKGWYFDTFAGREEILNRRIGRNELDAQQVCLAIVAAQREYALDDPMRTGLHPYATQFLSSTGQKNGLYWPTAEGEAPSPLGELVAEAQEQGYQGTHADTPRPYHGYYYRILTSQSANAQGGALDYILHGKMIGGFAIVAYPSDYDNSGVMTFITNYDGVVFQCDLGPDTDSIASKMTIFDPGPDWKKVQ